MTPSHAARPYARALWELARERNEIEAVGRDLQAMAATLADQPELRDLFARPWVPPAAKRAVAMEVVQRLGLSPLVRDLGEAYVARQQGRAPDGAAAGQNLRAVGCRSHVYLKVRAR